jgi:arylsulfatase
MSDKPNVLLITADHWPAALLGVAGHPVVQTPTLDQLARNGVRYTNAYTECPVCIPARRTLMTGTPPRTHGDRVFKTFELTPALPTLAQSFRDAGYQAFAVGKLHVYPQRDRIGFDDVILAEEGRPHLGAVDDYDLFLADQGYAGQGFAHGMCNNEYWTRPWHLPEHLHVTHWTTQQMARQIKRRDPTRPAFWYLSYCHPHPPLVPPQAYLDMYRDIEIDAPYAGAWAEDAGALPFALRAITEHWGPISQHQIRQARRAFYALCTHIDHQLRLVIGTLREEGLLDDTIILFTSDHGDMLGNHGLWAKRVFYEDSANVPLILVGATGDERVGHHRTDDRLVGWQDVMPTLLDLAGIPVPDTVEGLSTVGAETRGWLYGEWGEGPAATRMIHDGRYKLIYYATGNRLQLFDLQEDPHELNDLAASPDGGAIPGRLVEHLCDELYGGDEEWLQDGQLVGLPDRAYEPMPDRGLSGQRGVHYPPPPLDTAGEVVGTPS